MGNDDVRFREHFTESQPGIRVAGGFQNDAKGSLTRDPERISKLISQKQLKL
jgi:hypothetical protein